MSIAAGIQAPRIYVAEDESLNAFACGAGDRHSVVVTRGLLETLDRAELQAVVAHEIAHIRNGDTRLMTVLFGMSRVFSMTAAFAFGPLVALYRSARDSVPPGGTVAESMRERIRARLPKGPFSTRQKALFLALAPFGGVVIAGIGVLFSVLVMFLFTNVIRFLPWIALALAAWELWKLAGHAEPAEEARKPRRWSALLVFTPVGIVVGPAVLLLGAVFPLVFLLLRLAVSRNREFSADASAVELTRNPAALARALRGLRDDPNQASALPRALSPLAIARVGRRRRRYAALRPLLALFSTHPPLDERIERLEEMGAPRPPEAPESVAAMRLERVEF